MASTIVQGLLNSIPGPQATLDFAESTHNPEDDIAEEKKRKKQEQERLRELYSNFENRCEDTASHTTRTIEQISDANNMITERAQQIGEQTLTEGAEYLATPLPTPQPAALEENDQTNQNSAENTNSSLPTPTPGMGG